MNLTELNEKDKPELISIAETLGMEIDLESLPKNEIIFKMAQSYAEQEDKMLAFGVLDVINDGFGFLRMPDLKPSSNDVYVSQSQIRRFSLRTGDQIMGEVRPPKDNEKYYGLVRVHGVNGIDPAISKNRPQFDTLTPVFPDVQLKLETEKDNLSTRLMDLLSPVGRGQRGLIVAPPKAGKTTLLKQIAQGISANAPDVSLMVALIGERPEEVTDVKRSVQGEVFSSTFDDPVEDHCRVAELALDRGKRLVESGQDVVILLDSITRLTRAYNLSLPTSGRTLSGGIDPVALYPPKRFFGAARNTEEGGSLTIIAACLVDTGSRMDEVIYEEFKGTGNMEIHLDRKLAENRVFPAFDLPRSGTRREELLFDEQTKQKIDLLRRMVSMITSGSNSMDSNDAIQKIMEYLKNSPNNEKFLASLGQPSK
ncbi:MAG: transcription termination factor Rho [SAR202 cluster bacterium]|nr:transcription termination factor Rho [SAR202 cluster bacterium]|tara:strand:+ start:740 stop:2014 length:1275 start_codon:yes stop_codon:yes gene_type:complete